MLAFINFTDGYIEAQSLFSDSLQKEFSLNSSASWALHSQALPTWLTSFQTPTPVPPLTPHSLSSNPIDAYWSSPRAHNNA